MRLQPIQFRLPLRPARLFRFDEHVPEDLLPREHHWRSVTVGERKSTAATHDNIDAKKGLPVANSVDEENKLLEFDEHQLHHEKTLSHSAHSA